MCDDPRVAVGPGCFVEVCVAGEDKTQGTDTA